MGIPRAKLGDYKLPPQFSYEPYVPRKRMSTTATANAVVVQVAKPTQIVHGDSGIAWTCEACFADEANAIRRLYVTADPVVYLFTGYWGEVFEVLFARLDPWKVKGRVFNLAGMFQVVNVLTDVNAACDPVFVEA